MKLLYLLFKQDPESRDGIIMTTSALGIIINVLLSVVKIVIGLFTASIAIISEGVNGATDALSSLLTLLGAKLAGKHPDEKHPFGYGRIEYLVGLIVAGVILYSGIEIMVSSIELIFNPQELFVSYLAIAIVAGSAVIKFFLGLYTIKMGKKADSASLVGVGLECRNDAFASAITIVSSLVFVLFGFSIDAYAGIIISLLIIKAGAEVLVDTVGDLIGRPGEEALAKKLYKEIRETDGIISAADMMLHNYGPDRWSGSVNVEIDHKKTVGEIYEFLHALQLRIMHDYGVTMVFGVYAVDNDHEQVKELRTRIAAFVRGAEHINSFHAVYIDSAASKIYCDFTVDYKLNDWDKVREDFTAYLKGFYPDYELELVIETDFV